MRLMFVQSKKPLYQELQMCAANNVHLGVINCIQTKACQDVGETASIF